MIIRYVETLTDGTTLTATVRDGRLKLARGSANAPLPISLSPKDCEKVAIMFCKFLKEENQ